MATTRVDGALSALLVGLNGASIITNGAKVAVIFGTPGSNVTNKSVDGAMSALLIGNNGASIVSASGNLNTQD